MKICFFTDTIFMHGGVARVLTTMANELSKNNDITIFCMYRLEENNIYGLNKEKVHIKYFDEIKRGNISIIKKVIRRIIVKNKILDRKMFNNFNSSIKFPKETIEPIIEYINTNKFDVVVGVHIEQSMMLGKIKNKINAKAIGWQHNSFKAYFETPNKYVWNQVNLYKELTGNLDVNLVLTEDDKVKYKKKLQLDVSVMSNPNALIPTRTSDLNNKKFLSVGRLVDQKGFDLLIESYKYFVERGGDWKLDIVGEGEEEAKLKSLINKYKLSDLIAIKPFTNNIESEYISSDVYVLSSRYEGWGLVWIEAMSCGLPLVSFDLPPCKEVIRNCNVGLIVPEDVEELGKAMLSISRKKNLKEFSNNAIIISKKYDVTNIAKIWEELFKS